MVYRDEAHYRDEENLEIFPVDLQKEKAGLGLSIVGSRQEVVSESGLISLVPSGVLSLKLIKTEKRKPCIN